MAEAFDRDADECLGDWVCGVEFVVGFGGGVEMLLEVCLVCTPGGWWECAGPDALADDLADLPIFVVELLVEKLGGELGV